VARVVQETALRAEHRLQPGEHVVECCGDLRGLVPARDRDPLSQVCVGDPCGRTRDRSQRSENTSGQRQSQERGDDQRSNVDGDLRADRGIDLTALELWKVHDHEQTVLPVSLQRYRDIAGQAEGGVDDPAV